MLLKINKLRIFYYSIQYYYPFQYNAILSNISQLFTALFYTSLKGYNIFIKIGGKHTMDVIERIKELTKKLEVLE